MVIVSTDIARHTPKLSNKSDDELEYESLRIAFDKYASEIADFLSTDDAKTFKNRLMLRSISAGDQYRMIGPGTNEESLRPKVEFLEKIWSNTNITGINKDGKTKQANNLREIFRVVRNRLFHEDKDYSSTEDADLLQSLNPI